jgi:hypothetical protein
MKNTLVVVTDLGCFKAFKLENNQVNRTPRLELLEEFNNEEAHERLVERVTDLSGRFPRGAAKSGVSGPMSDGERHNIELESRKRLVRQMAARFNDLARDKEIERCLVATSKEIKSQFLDELDPAVRAKIEKLVPADLTKIQSAQIMSYF